VLLNLISNSLDAIVACEQCDKPGHICLTSERVDGGVCIVVADDGPGMDPDIGDDVFKPFVTGKKTGTGLGLAIVQNIMRAHRGRAVMDSRPGEGVKIRLFFPDAGAERARARTEDEQVERAAPSGGEPGNRDDGDTA
jgi:two-component system sensor histidine kinase HydH